MTWRTGGREAGGMSGADVGVVPALSRPARRVRTICVVPPAAYHQRLLSTQAVKVLASVVLVAPWRTGIQISKRCQRRISCEDD